MTMQQYSHDLPVGRGGVDRVWDAHGRWGAVGMLRHTRMLMG
jgi:hypothetical protein